MVGTVSCGVRERQVVEDEVWLQPEPWVMRKTPGQVNRLQLCKDKAFRP